jgi:hypothetical protein
MSSSQDVRASAPDSSKGGPALKRHLIERVEEWRKPRLTPDGRVLLYKGTRQPPQPIAILGRNRAGKTVTNGRETVRFDKHGFAEFETKFETLIDDVHIGISSHRMHFKAANQRLHEAVTAAPRLAEELKLSPGEIEALPTSTTAPSGYTCLHRPGAQPSWHPSAALLDPSAPALSLNTAPIPPIRIRARSSIAATPAWTRCTCSACPRTAP